MQRIKMLQHLNAADAIELFILKRKHFCLLKLDPNVRLATNIYAYVLDRWKQARNGASSQPTSSTEF